MVHSCHVVSVFGSLPRIVGSDDSLRDILCRGATRNSLHSVDLNCEMRALTW